MKLDANLLPDDPEQLKEMLLELQLLVAQKDNELVEKIKNSTKKMLFIRSYSNVII